MVKRALVLSGGGARGAYQLGVLKALCEEKHEWQSVHGISVGALNGAWMAMNSPAEQNYNIQGLYDIWRAIEKTDDMLKPWCSFKFINYIMSIIKGSFYSSKALKEIINAKIDSNKIQTSEVKFTVGCCSLNSGEYKVISGKEPNITDFVLASSLLPIVYDPIEINGERWVDGGIRHQIPIMEALLECPDEIDVILTRNPIYDRDVHLITDFRKIKSAPNIALRTSEIMNDQIYEADYNAVLRAIRALTNIKINLYMPTSKSPITDSMKFEKNEIEETIQLGYSETVLLLKNKKAAEK